MNRIFARMLNTLPKKLFAATIVAAAIALPAVSMAANTVAIEGSIGVANMTAGDTQYAHSVNATYDQVVKVQVYYHNTELPNSGQDAQNLDVKINMPTAPGQTQDISTTIKADNSNTVTDSATVNLDRADAYLQYIPGTAVWKHNIGTNASPNIVETNISDNVVYGANGLVLENEKPCYNFSATVTVEARVMVPGVKITKQVENANQTNAWTTSNTANPGDTLKYLISYQNTGNSVESQVVIRDNLPPKMTLVPGTTYLADASHPSGVLVSDDVTQGGINAGDFGAGANAYLTFEVKVPDASQLACGQTDFRNVGVVRPQNMNEYYNTADTVVNNNCTTPEQPTYTCGALTVNQSNHTVTVTNFQTTATNGATFKDAVIDWGDSSTPLTTNNVIGQSHTYTGNGPYTVSAVAHFDVNGQDASASSNACAQTVSFTTPTSTPPTTTPPTTLVNTGAGDVVGLFAAAVAAGALGYRVVLGRRLSRQ